jgi:hypothetical protein
MVKPMIPMGISAVGGGGSKSGKPFVTGDEGSAEVDGDLLHVNFI